MNCEDHGEQSDEGGSLSCVGRELDLSKEAIPVKLLNFYF